MLRNDTRRLAETDVTVDLDSADASLYYHETAAAKLAHVDYSAMLGNLADAMTNAVFLFPPPHKLPQPRLARIEST